MLAMRCYGTTGQKAELSELSFPWCLVRRNTNGTRKEEEEVEVLPAYPFFL